MFESLKNRIPGDIDEALYRKFAVAVPIVMKDGKPWVLFEVRASRLKRQPGDVCFPGGSREPGETPEENAVRELVEELCLDPSQVEVICQMDTFYTVADNEIDVFMIQVHDYQMTFSEDETDRVFMVPLDYLVNTEPTSYTNRYVVELAEDFPFHKIQGGRDYKWRGYTRKIYFYEYEDEVIWGMTAYIMQSVAKILRRESDEYKKEEA